MKYVLHKFRPSETIDAVIRLKGRHSFTLEELREYRTMFNELNGLVVPRVGETFKIPTEQHTTDDFGEVVKIVELESRNEPFIPPPPVIVEPVEPPQLVTSSRRRPR